MVFLYAISLFFLTYSSHAFSASSSDSAMSDYEDRVVIGLATPSTTPARGSRLRGLNSLSAMRLDTDLLSRGITPHHYDIAQSQIATQIKQVSLGTPRTDRSKHFLLEQICKEIERQKNVLSESVPVDSSSTDEEESYESCQHSDLSNEELKNVIKSQNIANTLLTQMIVRQQDDREHANELVRAATFRANVEAVFAIIGTLFGIAGTAIAIVPLFIH